MTTLFITSSGTEIGKTFVTVRLVSLLRAAGYAVRALKPVASGFDAAAAQASDSGQLLAAQDLPITAENLDAVSPWRFTAPLSPDMAAAREGRAVPFAELVEFCRAADRVGGVTIVEGIGGVMVPLDAQHTVLDWIAALEAPVLLVVGSYLGTLSHSLTAVAALGARRVRLAGLVVDESPEQPAPVEETAGVLARFVAPVPVTVLRRTSGASPYTAPQLWSLVAPFLAAPTQAAAGSAALLHGK